MLGLCRDNGKENGNYSSIIIVYGLEFEGLEVGSFRIQACIALI